MSGCPPSSDIDLSKADRHNRRLAEAAEESGHLDAPDHETMRCPCGYSGPPLAIIRYTEWDEATPDRDLWICPRCGDA